MNSVPCNKAEENYTTGMNVYISYFINVRKSEKVSGLRSWHRWLQRIRSPGSIGQSSRLEIGVRVDVATLSWKSTGQVTQAGNSWSDLPLQPSCLLPSFQNILMYIVPSVCLCVAVYTWVPVEARHTGSPGAGVTDGGEQSPWVLGTKHGLSARAALVLNNWAFSSAHRVLDLSNFDLEMFRRTDEMEGQIEGASKVGCVEG